MAMEAGHDINYLALTGALHAIGYPDRPPAPPLNLVADLGGGGMYLAFGILAAVHEARRSGRGQRVDAAMIDGVSHLMSAFMAFTQQGIWTERRADNIVDGGAPDYGCYETADGRHVAVGAIEPQFYAALLEVLGLDPAAIPDRAERANWPALKRLFADRFRQRTRAEWEAAMAGRDACFSPVLSITEAWEHPQMRARAVHERFGGLVHPAPAPRLSRTPAACAAPPRRRARTAARSGPTGGFRRRSGTGWAATAPRPRRRGSGVAIRPERALALCIPRSRKAMMSGTASFMRWASGSAMTPPTRGSWALSMNGG